jgi:hypothetical protein
MERQVPDPQVIFCCFILKNMSNIQVFDRSDLEGQNFPLHVIFSSIDPSWSLFSPSTLKHKTIVNSTQNTKIFKYNTVIKINQHSEPGPLIAESIPPFEHFWHVITTLTVKVSGIDLTGKFIIKELYYKHQHACCSN